MEPIIVKVSALLVMVQALANANMDFIALSTEAVGEKECGYLHFEAYRNYDPFIAYALCQNQISPAIDSVSSPMDVPALGALTSFLQ